MTEYPTSTRSRRLVSRRRSPLVVLAAGACVVLAACGSQVPPSKFVGAQAGLLGNGVAGGGSSLVANGGGGTVTGGGGGGTATTGNTGTGSTGGNGAVTTGGGGGGSTGGGGSSGGGGGKASSGKGGTGTGPSITAGSCAGFTNGPGMTNSTIKIANASDLSGPVPGLFRGAEQAVAAYVAYFNSTSSICGRKLELESLDSQTSSTGDQQAAQSACSSAFAMVGSMGSFDDGGAQTVTQCGIPDLRAATTEYSRLQSPDVYAAQSLNVESEPTEPADFYKKQFPGVASKAAFVYLNAGASSLNASSEIKAWTHEGFHFVYTAGIPVTEINYTGYVTKMQSAGVKYVQYVGAYQEAVQLEQAMAQQNFHPMFVMDPTAYDPGYVSSGGSAVEGTHVWINSQLFEDASHYPELSLYMQWLNRVSPGAAPSYFGIFAWAAAELFTQEAIKLGGKLTRKSLLQQLKTVDNYTGNGMFGPQHVGRKTTGSCYQFIVLKGGKWVSEGPGHLVCGGDYNTGVT